MGSTGNKSALIFDGDDTLWRTMPLYTAAKRRFFQLMERLGFEAGSVEVAFERRDVENVGHWGFTVERFRRSMVETLEEFSQSRSESPRVQIVERVSHIATSVSRNKTRRMPGAEPVLTRLKGLVRMILLTKGEYDLQERRVAESGFGHFFEEVLIVESKEDATFAKIAVDLSIDSAATWSVGDSLRSDILPALRLGMGAIWIPQETWEYESGCEQRHERLVRLSAISELPKTLQRAGVL